MQYITQNVYMNKNHFDSVSDSLVQLSSMSQCMASLGERTTHVLIAESQLIRCN